MKNCPVCKTSYEDNSLEKCAKDGAVLEVEEPLPKNPSLPEVVAASSDAITSDFDIEKVKDEQEKQATPPTAEINTPPAAQKIDIIKKNIKASPKKALKSKWIFVALAFLLVTACAVAFYFLFYNNNLVEVNLHSIPPGAEVILDGKKIGTTPLLVRIKKGTHQVVFEQIDYQPVKETLTVADDGHVLVKKMFPIVNPSP